MGRLKYKYIAIDFDGTIVDEMDYPFWGRLKPNAREVIKFLKDKGAQIAIWTCRGGEDARKVKEWLKVIGVHFDYFNEPFPDLEKNFSGISSPKIYADVYIDDRSIHCDSINWLDIMKKCYIDDENFKVGDKLKVTHYCGFEIGKTVEITHQYKNFFIIDNVAQMDKEECKLWFKKVSD